MAVMHKKEATLINEKIHFDKLQLITADGENLGIVSRDEALNLAKNANLDLVIISEMGGEGQPVAKILDFGKMLYAKKKKKSDAKKKQQVIQVKEVKIRTKIAEHDYNTKMNRGIQFLKKGKRLKLTVMFRGREISMKEERGTEMFNRIQETLDKADFAGKSLIKEGDNKGGNFWSRIYFLKK